MTDTPSRLRKLKNGWLTPALLLAIIGGLAAVAVFVFETKHESERAKGRLEAQQAEDRYRHLMQDEFNVGVREELKEINRHLETLHDNVVLIGERLRVRMIREEPLEEKEP